MIDIYDDVLHESDFEEVKNTVESSDFPWYNRYPKYWAKKGKDEYMYQNNILFSFAHICLGWDNPKSDYYDMTHELAEMCKIKANLDNYVTTRLRWGMQIRMGNHPSISDETENVLSEPHLDMKDFEHKDSLKVGVFYIHDSDSPTYIYDDDSKGVMHTIESKANRLLVMPGDVWHGGSKPRTHNFRIVLNMNWVDNRLVDYE
tara:strand:+ start:344 stop:952 length:609 start_codon:yes stop_codon:yes gene_type:complete